MTKSFAKRYPYDCLLFFFLVIICAIGIPALCRAEATSEYQVKAAFFYHFAYFVDWPIATFQATQDHLRICVMGKDPFGPSLDETLANKTVREHPFEIRRNPPISELHHCHLLYLPATASPTFQTFHHRVSKEDVLTVGETPEFLKQGGMVQFFVDNHKVRFAINTDVVNQTNLKVSSKLLRLAKNYTP